MNFNKKIDKIFNHVIMIMMQEVSRADRNKNPARFFCCAGEFSGVFLLGGKHGDRISQAGGSVAV